MTIDTMTITDTKEPIILDVGKVPHTEELILILLIWLVWNVALLCSMCILANDVLQARVDEFLLSLRADRFLTLGPFGLLLLRFRSCAFAGSRSHAFQVD